MTTKVQPLTTPHGDDYQVSGVYASSAKPR
jgi:hypothetical protein